MVQVAWSVSEGAVMNLEASVMVAAIELDSTRAGNLTSTRGVGGGGGGERGGGGKTECKPRLLVVEAPGVTAVPGDGD